MTGWIAIDGKKIITLSLTSDDSFSNEVRIFCSDKLSDLSNKLPPIYDRTVIRAMKLSCGLHKITGFFEPHGQGETWVTVRLSNLSGHEYGPVFEIRRKGGEQGTIKNVGPWLISIESQ